MSYGNLGLAPYLLGNIDLSLLPLPCHRATDQKCDRDRGNLRLDFVFRSSELGPKMRVNSGFLSKAIV